MLRESLRVLRPGGKVRLVTPNLDFLVSLFANDRSDLQQRYLSWATRAYLPKVEIVNPAFVLNHHARHWGHQFLYDHETLRRSVMDAGFVDLTFHAAIQTDEPAFKDVERHCDCAWLPEDMRSDGREMVAAESMAVEAMRPNE
jgi:predicted SAM-dependent methyltransferase